MLRTDVGEDFSPPVRKERVMVVRDRPTYQRRKPNRLPRHVYQEGGAFFLTTTVQQRRPAFLNSNVADLCLSILKQSASEAGVEIDSYCLMPDHLHLLITSTDGIDVTDFMYRFKKTAGFRCNRELGWQGPFWQASYFDHVLRKAEDIEPIREYILGNPVRLAMVDDPGDYPFSGVHFGRED